MIVLFYSTISGENGKKLEELIARTIPAGRMEIHRSVESLAQKVRQPEEERMIVLLALKRQEDLGEILRLRTYLENLRTVLVIPDQKEETIAAAHQLHPRFLTYVDGDFEGLAAVLAKMAVM